MTAVMTACPLCGGATVQAMMDLVSFAGHIRACHEEKTRELQLQIREKDEQWKRENCEKIKAEMERDSANRLNGEYQAALERMATLAIEFSDCPDGCPAESMQRDASRTLSLKRVLAPSICMVQTGCMGGVCGKLLPCDDHVKLSEICWCAAKAEAKDAKCPVHD